MSNESTNRIIGDTNSYVPRVLLKGSLDSYTQTTISSRYKNTASVTTSILSLANPLVDCYLYASGGGSYTLTKMNYVSDNPVGAGFGSAGYFWLDKVTTGGNSYVRLNVEIIKASSTLPQPVYYIFYSAGFSDEVVL